MYRRPFLKKLSLFTSVAASIPMVSFGRMNSRKEAKLKFIIASDGHYGQPDTDFETSHRNLIDAIHAEKEVDFVVFNGDLIHDEPTLMPKVKAVYNTLKVPYFPVKGNHDRISEDDWEKIWGISANYAFVSKENNGIILANSSNQAGDYLCANIEFMKMKLEEFKPMSNVFVCIHISQNDWTKHGVSCQEVLGLIADYPNVKAVFHGHDHDVDGIMYHSKKPYLWSGHFGGSWGSPHPGYRVCEVDENGKVKTYLKAIKDGMIVNRNDL